VEHGLRRPFRRALESFVQPLQLHSHPPPGPPSSLPAIEQPLSLLSNFDAPLSPTAPLQQQPRYAPPQAVPCLRFLFLSNPGILPHRSPRVALGHRLLRPAPARDLLYRLPVLLDTRQAGRYLVAYFCGTDAHLFTQRRTSATKSNVSRVPLPFFLSFTQLNPPSIYTDSRRQQHGLQELRPVPPLVLLRQAVLVHSCLEDTGDGDEQRGNCSALAYETR
jgi:hypothetical protein